MRAPAPPRSRWQLLYVLAILLVGFAFVPWARSPMPVNDPLVSSLTVLTMTFAALGALLLLGLFLADGDRNRLGSGAVFAGTAVALLMYGMSTPGVVSGGTLLGSGGTASVWLSGLFHAFFAVGLAVSGLPLLAGRVPEHARSRVLAWTLIVTLGVSLALGVVVVLLEPHLPAAIDGIDYSLYANGLGLVPAAICLVAVVVSLWATGPLQHHVAPMVIATFVDWSLYLYAHERYTAGWYVGRLVLLSVIAALLVSLIAETTKAFGQVVRQAATMRDAAETDPLTGLLNRRGVFGRLSRGHDYRTLVVIDVDLFKAINDTNGHETGDLALQVGAKRLMAHIREDDILARWGGDEFLLLTHAAHGEAQALLERLRLAATGDPVRIQGGALRLTISAGAAGFAEGADFDTVFDAADAALFEAKRSGRNRAVTAPVDHRLHRLAAGTGHYAEESRSPRQPAAEV